MKKVNICILMMLAFLIWGCSDSNKPSDNQDFKYKSTPFELIKVYGENGIEIPQNQWDENTIEIYNDFQTQVNCLKLLSYKFDGDNFISYYNSATDTNPYKMLGDTVVVTRYFGTMKFDIKEAILKNSNTLEFHFFTIFSSSNGLEIKSSGADLDRIDKIIADLPTTISELGSESQFVVFAGKYHFVK